MRWIFALLTAMMAMLNSGVAAGVTPVGGHGSIVSKERSVTTLAASRAHTEVQVRRLHSLLVSKQADDDTVDSYKRMQQRLRSAK